MYNFIFALGKSDSYLLDGVKESYKILLHCIQQINNGYERKIFRQIASVELRKLLCDQPESILTLDKKIKLAALSNRNSYTILSDLKDEDKFLQIKIEQDEDKVDKLSLKKWLTQKLFYIEGRTALNVANFIVENVYNEILKHRLKSDTKKKQFENLFNKSQVENEIRYTLIESVENRELYFKFINDAGFNDLDIRNAIKLVANKAGAHSATEDPVGLLQLRIKDEYSIFDWIILRVFSAMKSYIEL